jgi:iduronate 2-sulfatase
MAPETLSPGKLELLSPKNLHYGSNFARMILPDEFASTQADYLAANQPLPYLKAVRQKHPHMVPTSKK